MPVELDGSDPQAQPDYEDLMRRLMGSASGTPDSAQPAGDAPAPTAPADPSRIVRSNPIGPRQAPPENVSAPAMASAWGAPPAAAVKTAPTPSEIPSPMGTSTPGRIQSLVAQRAQVGQPLDPNAVDPNTGKPKYKMGIGSRILGTLSIAARGFASDGRAEPIFVGPGAKNNRYYTEEASREAQSANLDTEITNQEKVQGMNQKAYEDAIKSSYETMLGGARKETADAATARAAAAGETADVRQQLEASQAELNRAKAGKAENAPPANEWAGWYSSFSRENGRPPNAKEIQQYELTKARAGKDTSFADLDRTTKIATYKSNETDKISKQMESERSRRYAELEKDLDKAFIVGPTRIDRSASEKQKIDQQLEEKYNPKIQAVSDEADKLFSNTKTGAKLKSTPKPVMPAPGPVTLNARRGGSQAVVQPPANPAGQPPPKPPAPPAPGKVWVYEKASGKRGQIPQSQLKQATEGANAQYGTW